MSDVRLVACAASPGLAQLEMRLAGRWAHRAIELATARADPLWFQSQIASVDCVISDAAADEEVRALCADVCEVIPLGGTEAV